MWEGAVQLQCAAGDPGGGLWFVPLGPGSASDRALEGQGAGDGGFQFCKRHGLHLENRELSNPQ